MVDKTDFELELALIKRRLDELEAVVRGRVVPPLADADGGNEGRVVMPKWEGLPTEVKAWGSVEQYLASVATVSQPLRIAFPMPDNVDPLGGLTDAHGDVGGPDESGGKGAKVSRPANHGKPWTEEADLALMASLRPMVNWETICLKAGRSSTAVLHRLMFLGLVEVTQVTPVGGAFRFEWRAKGLRLTKLLPAMTEGIDRTLKVKHVLLDSGWRRHTNWANLTLPVDLPPIPRK